MFDQQMFLATRRHHTHRRKPYYLVRGGDAVSGQRLPEIDQNTSLHETEETSMEELSGISFSSSSNSLLSVPDCNKSAHQETLLFEQTFNPDKSFIVLPNIKNSNVDPCRFLDFRNLIRDSINRGFHTSKSFDESKEEMYTNITLSTPFNSSESVELSSPSSCSEFKEDHGFSHGRSEISNRSIDANGSTNNSELKPNVILSNNGQQSTNHKKSTSVIAKLMGLETMPQEPILQNSDSLLMPVCKSRNLVENAPWKKNGKCRLLHDDKLFTHREDKGTKEIEDSVYKEIERKLIELEAVKSKDLRALKQILDAMEEKGLLEPERNDQHSYQSSPIVVMKPVNPVKRLNVSSPFPSSSIIHNSQSQTSSNKLSNKQPFNSRLREISQMKTSNKMVQRLDSLSPPRLQKEKLVKEILHPLPSFSSTNNNHQSESVKPKPDKAKDCHELLLNKKKKEVKNLNCPRKELVQRSEKNVPAKKLKKPSIKVSQGVSTNAKENTSAEQPSPVSVLDDSSVYQDSPQSPSNDSSNCCKYGKNQIKKSASRINHMKKFKSIENLLQKLDDLSTSSSNDYNCGGTDHIAYLCGIRNPNPSDRYISQILLASGILFQDMESKKNKQISLHSSGYPINPDLFLVLEQTNACNNKSKNNNDEAGKEKLDRKLIFDVVNEMLMNKLLDVSGSRGQQLIKELCEEIDALMQLQTMAQRNEDCSEVVEKSKAWVNFKEVVPGLVLEVERLIFKDLIVETIYGEVDCYSKLKSNVSTVVTNQH